MDPAYNRDIYAISEIEKCKDNFENIMNIYLNSNLYRTDVYNGLLIFESFIKYWKDTCVLSTIRLNDKQIELIENMNSLQFYGDTYIFVKLMNSVFRDFMKMNDPYIKNYLINIKDGIIFLRDRGMYRGLYHPETGITDKIPPPNENEIIDIVNNLLTLF